MRDSLPKPPFLARGPGTLGTGSSPAPNIVETRRLPVRSERWLRPQAENTRPTLHPPPPSRRGCAQSQGRGPRGRAARGAKGPGLKGHGWEAAPDSLIRSSLALATDWGHWGVASRTERGTVSSASTAKGTGPSGPDSGQHLLAWRSRKSSVTSFPKGAVLGTPRACSGHHGRGGGGGAGPSPRSPGGRCRRDWLCSFSSALAACSGFLERHRHRSHRILPVPGTLNASAASPGRPPRPRVAPARLPLGRTEVPASGRRVAGTHRQCWSPVCHPPAWGRLSHEP